MPFGKWEEPTKPKCNAFANCIQPHICNPTGACIWGQEAQKVVNDATMFGVGYHEDGKHVPADQVYVGNIQQSVKTTDGILTLEIVGDLGLDYSDEGWMIYHLPTGAKFGKAVPTNNWSETEYDREPLLRWMKKVQENWAYDPYWLILAKLTPDTYKDAAQDAKDIIQNWCLSVRVE